jgi:hypothetical protein
MLGIARLHNLMVAGSTEPPMLRLHQQVTLRDNP